MIVTGHSCAPLAPPPLFLSFFLMFALFCFHPPSLFFLLFLILPFCLLFVSLFLHLLPQ